MQPDLPRLRAGAQLVSSDGSTTSPFQRWWEQLCRAIEQPAYPLRSFTVASLPTAPPAGLMIYVTDESGGEVPAFSDSTGAWRRVTDRAVVS